MTLKLKLNYQVILIIGNMKYNILLKFIIFV